MGNAWSCRGCHHCRQCTNSCGPCSKLIAQSQGSSDAAPVQHYPVSGLEFPLEQHICGDFVEPVESVNSNEGTNAIRKALDPGINLLPMRLEPKASQIANIGCRRSMTDLEEECRFNVAKVQRVRNLSQSYTHWRPIRGDGNCFYRTVIFGALESLLATGEFCRVGKIMQAFQQVHFDTSNEQHAHEILMQHLQSQGTLNPNQLEHLIATDALMDQAIIRVCRRLVRLFLLEKADIMSPNGLTYMELAQAMSSTYKTMEDFCREVVDPMGRDVETIAVDALPRQLGVGLRLWILDRRDEVDLVSVDTPGPDGKLDVHVLFKPGHYDLLYPKSKP